MARKLTNLTDIMTSLKVSDSEIKNHQINPENVRNILADTGYEEAKVPRKITLARVRSKPKLDSNKFVNSIHNYFKGKVPGYAFQLRKGGVPHQTLIWDWARRPVDAGTGWSLDTRMHIASVSKMITAIAMYKLLSEKKISLDATIVNYLPTYWKKGNNVSKITFRNLLNHTSGFDTGDSKSDFSTMKSRVSAGVSLTGTVALGKGKYANMNFGLCRILIPIINSDINKNTRFNLPPLGAAMEDSIWDSITISAYQKYVQSKVLNPAGVKPAGFVPMPFIGALAYNLAPINKKGWDSGNLKSMSGGASWRLSVNEVLDVMNHLRRKGTILSKIRANYLLEQKLGLDWNVETPAGKWYSKNGRWTNTTVGTEQCVAAFLPEDYELVIFVNGPLPNPGLMNTMYDLYTKSLV
ncbi:serine hydrolase domain-containing protein [Belliella marina]|uniref:Serine hydrolase domain-containing protein n=1 Tax=Belliella marina TaxID=1644146 RepID=A0ABW4VRL0_9BACT